LKIRLLIAGILRAALNTANYGVRQLQALRTSLRGSRLTDFASDGLIRPRRYSSYRDYVRHQQSKVESWRHVRAQHWSSQLSKFTRHFCQIPEIGPGSSVICLGARWGEECAAFAARGALAIGVDLNPDECNKWVVQGDFHTLQFPDGAFTHAYTNVIDHVLNLQQFVQEVHRVLRCEDALWIADIYRGRSETGKIDSWGALLYESADDIVEQIVATGLFTLERTVVPLSANYLSIILRARSQRLDTGVIKSSRGDH
jgi:hypothetical protein